MAGVEGYTIMLGFFAAIIVLLLIMLVVYIWKILKTSGFISESQQQANLNKFNGLLSNIVNTPSSGKLEKQLLVQLNKNLSNMENLFRTPSNKTMLLHSFEATLRQTTGDVGDMVVKLKSSGGNYMDVIKLKYHLYDSFGGLKNDIMMFEKEELKSSDTEKFANYISKFVR